VDGLDGQPLLGENFPAWNQDRIGTGSTDVGDVSWITPLCELNTACFATGSAGHSWGHVATSGMSIGHKGMMHAAKVMAVAAMDLWLDPTHLREARKEFERETAGRPYTSPLPEDTLPPQYPNPVRGVD
jgi:aminobenzoyl-glutamate utilization protein B